MLKLFVSSVKMQFRDRMGLFWALAFPLLFVLVFGAFFGGSNQTIGTVTFVDNARDAFSKALEEALVATKVYKVKTASYTVEEAKQAIKDDKTSFVIIVPEGFNAGLVAGNPPPIQAVYSTGDTQVRSAAMSFLNDFVNRANLIAVNAEPVFTIQPIGTLENNVTFFDFVFAGILCLAIMNYNIVNFASSLTNYREKRILKRLQTTPLKVRKFMGAQILSFLVLNALQLGIILLVGVVLFKAHIYGNYADVILLGLFGSILFLSVGFLIASFSKTINAATGIGTSVSILMMFMSGVFFAIQNLPGWLYNIVRWLPLSPMITAMRNIALESQSLWAQWQYLLVMLGWVVVTLLLTAKFYRFGD